MLEGTFLTQSGIVRFVFCLVVAAISIFQPVGGLGIVRLLYCVTGKLGAPHSLIWWLGVQAELGSDSLFEHLLLRSSMLTLESHYLTGNDRRSSSTPNDITAD